MSLQKHKQLGGYEMFTNRKRVTILIIISALMNLFLFLCAYFLNLPLWLDTTGTIYAALILGFPAGFIVAIINNVLQALFFYGLESLRFYLVSALTALVTGLIMSKFAHKPILRWFLLALGLWILSTSLAIFLTFIAYNGIPADHWGRLLYNQLLENTVPWKATVLSVGSIKTMDILVSIALVAIVWRLTPRALRTDKVAVRQ